MTLLIVSFIAGVLTVLAPCILPLLPVIIGKSVSDTTVSKRRVFVIVVSLGLSVILFTLILKVSTLFVNIPQDIWKYVSGGIIFIFGVVTLFPRLWESLPFTSKINIGSNKILMKGYQRDSILGDAIVGASLGPIFSACSPTYFVILATVLPVSPTLGIVYLLTYTIGLCLSLLFVVFVGQKIMNKLGVVANPEGWFKKTLGILFIIVSIGILTGYDKKLQISLLDAGFFDVTKIEQKLLDTNSNGGVNEQEENLTLEQKKEKLAEAPDLSTIDGYINTDGKPITISEFKGKKVVLLDIWTYSCINCQRTTPYLNEWHKKYEDDGLVIIGLHTPEFAFEKVQNNVEDAVKNFGIKYPVVLDNDFSTWNAYENQYWPRKYLIDIDGYIVYDHAGEGQYAETEKAIQRSLRERNTRLGRAVSIEESISDPSGKVVVSKRGVQSPEVYFGSARNEYLANGVRFTTGKQILTIPESTSKNKLYLGGTWTFDSEYMKNNGAASISFKYEAKNVYMVAHSKDGAEIEVYIDGKLDHVMFIQANKLYDIVKGIDYGEHTLLLKIKSGSVDAYTFTFG